jgi:hypothetical protein
VDLLLRALAWLDGRTRSPEVDAYLGLMGAIRTVRAFGPIWIEGPVRIAIRALPALLILPFRALGWRPFG